jgi:hypothetical protein
MTSTFNMEDHMKSGKDGDPRLVLIKHLEAKNDRLAALNAELLEALKAYGELTALFGRNHRPDWWTDDQAWQAYVTADEKRIEILRPR